MKRILAILAALGLAVAATPAAAEPNSDPLGDLISKLAFPLSAPADWQLRATLYHAGGRGIRALDSLGCPVSPMRTLAVDPTLIPRHTIVFIKETVGMLLPDGSRHDGYWYASDIGGAIKGKRVDLFTGKGASSMQQFLAKGLSAGMVTALKVGTFDGCPPRD